MIYPNRPPEPEGGEKKVTHDRPDVKNRQWEVGIKVAKALIKPPVGTNGGSNGDGGKTKKGRIDWR